MAEQDDSTAVTSTWRPSPELQARIDALGQVGQVSTGGVLGSSGGFVPPAPPGENRPFEQGDAEILLRSMVPTEIAALQDTLMSAGVMRSPIVRGELDSDTVSAYQGVLELSNLQSRAPSVVLNSLSAAGIKLTKDEKQKRLEEIQAARKARQPFVAQVSNADELRQLFGDEVVRMTGRGGTVDVDKMVRAFQGEQQNAQARAYNATRAGGPNAVVEAAPSASAFAEQAIGEAAPTEVQATNVVDRAGQLFDMLGKFGGQ